VSRRGAAGAVSGVALVALGAWAWMRYEDAAHAAADPASASVTWVRDSLPALAFRICNNGYRPIARVAFTAETPGGAGPARELVADTVLAQAHCAVMTWPGEAPPTDSLIARVTRVEGKK
jgi:hypothetical protein